MVRDREEKMNLPRGLSLPPGLRRFEGANELLLTARSNYMKKKPNISPEEKVALKDLVTLQREKQIIIKLSDKKGGWVILNYEDYMEEMERKLAETFVEDGEEKKKYPLSSNTQLKREWRRIKDCVKRGVEEGFIGEKDGQEAMPREPKAGRIYANVKDHKPISPTGLPPCREIVSGSGANTENLGKIVDAIIKPINEKNRSYIQDTLDLLRKIQEMNSRGPQPPGTVPVTLDITALYPSIPTKKGLVVLRERLERGDGDEEGELGGGGHVPDPDVEHLLVLGEAAHSSQWHEYRERACWRIRWSVCREGGGDCLGGLEEETREGRLDQDVVPVH